MGCGLLARGAAGVVPATHIPRRLRSQEARGGMSDDTRAVRLQVEVNAGLDTPNGR